MNILILSDIETAGEWLATQSMLSEIKKKSGCKFFLLAYGQKTLHLHRNLFEESILIDHAPLAPPISYYRQIILELKQGATQLIRIGKTAGKFSAIITTSEYSLFLPTLIVFPFVKKIFYLHGLKHHFKIDFNHFNLHLLLIKFLERLTWFLSDYIVVPSAFAKKVLKRELVLFYFLKKIYVIPNLVPDYFLKRLPRSNLMEFKKKLGLRSFTQLILYCGRIDKIKGIDNLIVAFSLLKKKLSDSALIISYTKLKQDKNLLNKLRNQVGNYQLKNSIFLISDLPRTKLPFLYQLVDCAVFPSLFEMDSLALKETLASGLPAFSTPVGNAPILLGGIDKNLLLGDNSVGEIYRKLNAFFAKSTKERRILKEKVSKIFGDKFSAAESVNKFLKLLD